MIADARRDAAKISSDPLSPSIGLWSPALWYFPPPTDRNCLPSTSGFPRVEQLPQGLPPPRERQPTRMRRAVAAAARLRQAINTGFNAQRVPRGVLERVPPSSKLRRASLLSIREVPATLAGPASHLVWRGRPRYHASWPSTYRPDLTACSAAQWRQRRINPWRQALSARARHRRVAPPI